MPYISSISLMISGSKPCAPRYLESKFEELPESKLFNVSPSPPPENRAVDSKAVHVICAIICSTGPPGTICTTAKFISMMPINVGKTRSNRLIMYAAID